VTNEYDHNALRADGARVLNLDVRSTQSAAIHVYETLGYHRWGTHPCYAMVEGKIISGHFYFKRLDGPEEDEAA